MALGPFPLLLFFRFLCSFVGLSLLFPLLSRGQSREIALLPLQSPYNVTPFVHLTDEDPRSRLNLFTLGTVHLDTSRDGIFCGLFQFVDECLQKVHTLGQRISFLATNNRLFFQLSELIGDLLYVLCLAF